MTVKVKKEIKLDPNAPYPVCVNGKNAGPPEDVGSYPGFEHFIQVMKNKKHKDYRKCVIGLGMILLILLIFLLMK